MNDETNAQLINDILQIIGKDPVGLALELADRVRVLETDLEALSTALALRGELEPLPVDNDLTFRSVR